MEASITSADAYGRPSLRFVVSHPAHFIAFGFGVGLSPVAPGTFGTLLALPMYAWLAPRLDNQQFLLLLAGMFIGGAWACEVSGRRLGVHDHGGMVWDEVTAFLAVLFFTPATPLWQGCAFLLFRLFDIVKPMPIRYFDRNIRNGLGVMFDDVLAAFYALLCLAGWKFLFG
jgi:phosphatidylglycerophosphatase A